ncbi:Ethylene-responsive transcription factor Related to AP22-12 [Forsythia ovata]|uniref:Ethylene-responsive transcription factor Related to AP22-12 n=1 Tax=Forsythia ovata TaxID=205694 RepID=A0ABD1SR25_9LAMI
MIVQTPRRDSDAANAGPRMARANQTIDHLTQLIEQQAHQIEQLMNRPTTNQNQEQDHTLHPPSYQRKTNQTPTSSRRLTAYLLWGSSGGADLINGKKKVPENYHSKPLSFKSVVDIDDDFEADFQEFKDYLMMKWRLMSSPFAFSA